MMWPFQIANQIISWIILSFLNCSFFERYHLNYALELHFLLEQKLLFKIFSSSFHYVSDSAHQLFYSKQFYIFRKCKIIINHYGFIPIFFFTRARKRKLIPNQTLIKCKMSWLIIPQTFNAHLNFSTLGGAHETP